MSIRNSFVPLTDGRNKFTRKFGGVDNSVDPYLTGYHFISFSKLPSALLNYINSYRGTAVLTKETDIKNILESSVLSVTTPGKSVNKVDLVGLGGVTWGAVGNVTQDTTLSMRFLEYSGLPIHSIFHGWVRMLRDSRYGISTLANYGKVNYASNVYYWTTQPDGETVEYAACYTGVFPLKDPGEVHSSDVNSNAQVEIDIDMSFDYLWEEPWCYSYCQNEASRIKSNAITTINTDYTDLAR